MTIKAAVQDALLISPVETKAVVANVAFVNLARFKYMPEPELVGLIGSMREAELGAFKVNCIELVETDKLLSLHQTIVRSKIALRS